MEYLEEYFCFVEYDFGNIDKNCDALKSIKMVTLGRKTLPVHH